MIKSVKPKVYIVRASDAYIQMFRKEGFELCTDLKEAAIVCFTGGEDVSPSLYNEDRHPRTFFNLTRDVYEQKVYETCKKELIPMVGICRGGQFLNVMSGGKMYQHVENHTAEHMIVDVSTGEEVFVSSTHHQMMRPGKDAEVVAIANEKGKREYVKDGIVITVTEPEPDIEVLFYPNTDALCFQPHPEFYTGGEGAYHGMHKYFFRLISEFFNIRGIK